ncbi:uncharacterized protein PFLUO_LOCUS5660 [Penicillium psychrofluorescens]|uniref:uncharacterized protein n=1 Tax=Penicillium psychrofluorescens TaxID=3158075 RepID=UPI003CCDCE45
MSTYTHTNLTGNSTFTEETQIDKASLAMPMLCLLFAFLFIVCLYYQVFWKCTKRGIRLVRRANRLARRKIGQWNRNLREGRGLFQEINNHPNRNTYELDEVVSLSDSWILSSSSSSSNCSSSYLEHASGSGASLISCPADESNAHHGTDLEPDYGGFTFNKVTWSSQDTTLVNPAELPPISSDQIAEDSHNTSPNTSSNDNVDAVVFVTGPDTPKAQWGLPAYIRGADGPGAFVDRIVDWAVQRFMGGAADSFLLRHQLVPSDHVLPTEDDHEDTSLGHAA